MIKDLLSNEGWIWKPFLRDDYYDEEEVVTFHLALLYDGHHQRLQLRQTKKNLDADGLPFVSSMFQHH